MERLTKQWGNNCVPIKLDLECLLDISDEQAEQLQAIIKKLAEYEDAEEQGLLLRLPCKVGDSIYRFWYVDNIPYRVQKQTIRTLSNLVAIMESGEFGKTVFLTKAEAEQKLAEMKGDV